MIIFGAVYFALPRITGREIPIAAKSFHFWTSTFGVLLLLLAYLIGGLTHGVLAGPAIIGMVVCCNRFDSAIFPYYKDCFCYSCLLTTCFCCECLESDLS